MTITQDTTAQQIYDPENLGAWDGQLPHADLVDQLPPAQYPLPDLDNTVKTLFYWAMDLDIPHGPRLALLTILRHINWKEGDHCTAGIKTLARESHFSTKTLKEHIKFLVAQKLISRLRHVGRITETRLGTVGVETSPMAGVETSPIVGVAATPETNSSSTNSINQLGPGLVDAKRVDDSEPETGVTRTGVKSPSFEEEGVTGTGVTVQDAEAWIDRNISETPQPFEVEQLGKHCWPAWSKHWDLDLAGAIVVWTKTPASRRKFRKDAVMHLVKVGLPKPPVIDHEQELARGRTSEQFDRTLAEAPYRKMAKRCAGCKMKRQLKPGETHCYACRNLSEDPRIASQPDRGTCFADEYESVIEENIRRYEEERGSAPEDAKAEAVGAALDAGHGQAAK